MTIMFAAAAAVVAFALGWMLATLRSESVISATEEKLTKAERDLARLTDRDERGLFVKREA